MLCIVSLVNGFALYCCLDEHQYTFCTFALRLYTFSNDFAFSNSARFVFLIGRGGCIAIKTNGKHTHMMVCIHLETFSYYGILNYVSFNVGYHNEHHDFPAIPYTRLPEVKRLAPEFYDNIPYHKSWVMATWHFITSDKTSLQNRVMEYTPETHPEEHGLSVKKDE